MSTAASSPTEALKADRPRALVFEGNDRVRAVACEVLRREKFEVFPRKEVGDIVRLAKELLPAVLLLDVELPGIDPRTILGILSRCRETRPVRAILICSAEYDEARCASLKSQGAFGVLRRPLTRQAIIDLATAALKSSQEKRAKLDAALARRPPVARAVESTNSLLVRPILCPFHEDPVPFNRYTLRTGKIATESSFFDLTIYKSDAPGADFFNYHLCAAMVCPRCWFTSIHAAYFLDPAGGNAPVFNEATRRELREAAVARRPMAADLPADFYTEQRSIGQAIVSYELAIACSRILFERNRHSMAIELARIGNYHLRIAHLKELSAAPPEAIDVHYRDAMTSLAEAFTIVDGSRLFKIAYQVAALAIHFGQDKTAHQYLNVMIESERDKALPSDQRAGLMRYLPRCQRAWEDRDLHRGPLFGLTEAA